MKKHYLLLSLFLLPLTGLSMERYYNWIRTRETLNYTTAAGQNWSQAVVPANMSIKDLHEALARKIKRDIAIKYFVLPAAGLMAVIGAGITYYNS